MGATGMGNEFYPEGKRRTIEAFNRRARRLRRQSVLEAADQILQFDGACVGRRKFEGRPVSQCSEGRGQPPMCAYDVPFEELDGTAKDA